VQSLRALQIFLKMTNSPIYVTGHMI
jgi:hypothetical protein